MKRVYEMCLDQIIQKKTQSTDINMLKRKPANQYYQTLPCYMGKHKPKQQNFDFESAREVLMEADEEWLKKDDLTGYIMRKKL